MDSRSLGTTLPELMVVLAILSLIMTLGLPNFEGSIEATEARQFSQIITRTLTLARVRAVGTNERVTFCASEDGIHCQKHWPDDVDILVFSDRNKNKQLDADDLLHHRQALSLQRGQGFWRGSAGRPYMRFRVDGSAVEFGRYTYCPDSGEDNNFKQLVVNRVGRAYLHNDGAGRHSDCS